MKKLKIGVIIAAIIIFVAELFIIDYNSLFSSENLGNYLVMLTMVLLILGQTLPFGKNKKEANN
ncbi:hypothetical protein SLH46_06965 [Draconibacterium sp. IB214405]|uniref:hypothetical protein n=1 Tax=Draconibacterium sp. IB214405 TaxID=3097352 RepID=UPI002A15BE36|nr:hypothetical protein [Draconibacterium sp. IB214405]MDX8338916.1 hypothetical protein [Draconibacterium sp. IB214405]